MSKRIAILAQTGNLTDPWPTKGAGIYTLVNRAIREIPSLQYRLDAWIGIRPFNADLTFDAADIATFNPDVIAHVDHSHGAGLGLPHFAANLAAIGRRIDLVIAIDPVPYLCNPFVVSESPFVMPEIVDAVLGFRTRNCPPFSPCGRSVACAGARRQIIFGANETNFDDGVLRTIQDSIVTHATIDNDPRVHEESIAALRRLVEG